jgi:hypothetical protein
LPRLASPQYRFGCRFPSIDLQTILLHTECLPDFVVTMAELNQLLVDRLGFLLVACGNNDAMGVGVLYGIVDVASYGGSRTPPPDTLRDVLNDCDGQTHDVLPFCNSYDSSIVSIWKRDV